MQVATLFAVLCALAFSNEAEARFGLGCPQNIKPMQNFQLDKYAGRWFEISSLGAIFEKSVKCSQAAYTPNQHGGVDFKNTMFNTSTLKTESIKGWANLEDNSGAAKLKITLFYENTKRTAPMWILGTDYENYSVVYSCTSFVLFHFEEAWILSRQTMLEEEHSERANKVLLANWLAPSTFIPQIQDCGVLD